MVNDGFENIFLGNGEPLGFDDKSLYLMPKKILTCAQCGIAKIRDDRSYTRA